MKYLNFSLFFTGFVTVIEAQILKVLKMSMSESNHEPSKLNDKLTMDDGDLLHLRNTFVSEHLIETMVVFCSIISIVTILFFFCWFRHFRYWFEVQLEEEENENEDRVDLIQQAPRNNNNMPLHLRNNLHHTCEKV